MDMNSKKRPNRSIKLFKINDLYGFIRGLIFSLVRVLKSGTVAALLKFTWKFSQGPLSSFY